MLQNKLKLEFPRKDPALKIPKVSKKWIAGGTNLEKKFKVQYIKLGGFFEVFIWDSSQNMTCPDLVEGPFIFPSLPFSHEAAIFHYLNICHIRYALSPKKVLTISCLK